MQGEKNIISHFGSFLTVLFLALIYTWCVPNKPLLFYTLDSSHYQNFLLFHHILSPDFAIPGYHPFNNFLSFLCVVFFNKHPFIFQSLSILLVTTALWNFVELIKQLSPKKFHLTALIALILMGGLALFQIQVACYENMWISFILAIYALRKFLQDNTHLSSCIINGFLVGVACAINNSICYIWLIQFAWLILDKNKQIYRWLLAFLTGWLLILLPWLYWIHTQGIDVLNWSWLSGIFLEQTTYPVNEKPWVGWVFYFTCLLAGSCFFASTKFKKLCFTQNHTLQRYSLLITLCWVLSLYIIFAFSLSQDYFPSNDYAFMLHVLSIPVVAMVITYSPWKKLQFAGGILCAAMLFYNTSGIFLNAPTDHLLDVKLPYEITDKDQVFFSQQRILFIAAFLPPQTSVKVLQETSDLDNPKGHTYLIVPYPYQIPFQIREYLGNDDFEPQSEKIDPTQSICLPILTNRTFGYNPLLCKLN